MLQGINTEVRYMIFEMLLQPRVGIDENTCIEPAILLTCRQFYNEAKPVLYNNTLAVHIGMYFSNESEVFEAKLGSRRNSEAHYDERDNFELIAKFRSLHVQDDEPIVWYMVGKLCRRIYVELTLDCRQPPNYGYVQESYYACKQYDRLAACSIIRNTRRDKEFTARPTILKPL